MKKSDKWYDKFMYVLGLPVWSGSTLTIKQIRYEMAAARNGCKISRIAVLNSG
jgi:hypothetical protein